MQDRTIQTAQSLLSEGKSRNPWRKVYTPVEYDGNEKPWRNLDKSDIIKPEAETKGEFSE